MSASVPAAGVFRPGLLAAAFAGLMLVLYADPLFVRRNFADRDLTVYNVPMEKGVHDAWARGRMPVWTVNVSGGRPLLPNPNAGALYPLRLILSRVEFPLSLRIAPVFHWTAAGIGMLLLGMALGRSVPAAWVGAMTYAFSGVVVGEAFFPHIQPGMALLPWIIWALARRSGSRVSRWLLLSLLFALDLLAADVFTITLAIACAACWIALEERSAEQLRSAASLALAIGVGALAALPQILATALWAPYTNRGILGMKLFDVLQYSVHPWRLLELVIPFPFGPGWKLLMGELWAPSVFARRPMGLFPTLYCGAFAVIAVASSWKASERGARFARVVLIGALLASVTPSLLPSSWGTLSSPLPLRNPEKFAVAIVFALALLCGIAFDRWRSQPRRLGWALGIGGLLAGLSAASAWDASRTGRLAVRAVGSPASFAPEAGAQLPLALAEAGLLWMLTVIALDFLGRPGRRRVAVATLLLSAVPILANRRIAKTFSQDEIFSPPAFARYANRNDPEGQYRTVDETLFLPPSELAAGTYHSTLSDIGFARRSWFDQTQALFGRGTVFNRDFDAGDLSRIESLRQVSGQASGFRDSDAFFGTVALKWGIRFRDQQALAGYHPIGGDALQIWDEHDHPYPDIRLLESWLEVPGSLVALQALPQLGPGEVVIESGEARRGSVHPGSVRVLSRSPERLELSVDSPDGGWLFVLRGFWPYRTILVDGKPVEAVPAQLAFSAVPIPPGAHRVSWKEELPGWSVSRFGPVLFGVLVAAVAVVDRRRRKQ